MNVITDTCARLVRRKLWPVALLLVAALVAVPLVLAKEPEPVAAAPTAHAAKAEGLPATFVSAADGRAEDGRAPPRAGRAQGPVRAGRRCRRPSEEEGRGEGQGRRRRRPPRRKTGDEHDRRHGRRRPTPPAAPSARRRPPRRRRRIPRLLDQGPLRPDRGGGAADRDGRAPRRSCRDEENPVLVYRGVEDGGKVAVFELTGDVAAEGDGKCAPTPEDCQTSSCGPARPSSSPSPTPATETDAQYQLDLVKITPRRPRRRRPRRLDGAKRWPRPRRARSRASSSCASRNRYVFDATTGHAAPARGKSAQDPALSL